MELTFLGSSSSGPVYLKLGFSSVLSLVSLVVAASDQIQPRGQPWRRSCSPPSHYRFINVNFKPSVLDESHAAANTARRPRLPHKVGCPLRCGHPAGLCNPRYRFVCACHVQLEVLRTLVVRYPDHQLFSAPDVGGKLPYMGLSYFPCEMRR